MKKVEKWTSCEISFLANVQVDDISDAEADVTFTHESGLMLTVPAFWDGGFVWRVRFAPNMLGKWNYCVKETQGIRLGIDGISGELNCVEYTGEYEIYKRGFIKAVPNVRHFMYDDGTPFFYLGDTHWLMFKEEFDEKGSHAVDVDTNSHFKYIVDKRVEQKFTVYQSEPIDHKYNIFDGIDEEDIKEFQRFDKYFKYIASKGLVHANAQLIFPKGIQERFYDEEFLRVVTRFWVARYASYPVLWTLGQEVDSHFYGFIPGFTVENNPFKVMCRLIYKFDPYKHPITAHQENAMRTGALGNAEYDNTEYEAIPKTPCIKYSAPSAFLGMKEHTWWGVQWRSLVHKQYNFNIPKDYWYNGEGKVTVNYEAYYDYLYTKNYGARVNGWLSYLNGMFGYGYGAADIWAYKLRYNFNTPTFDGVDTVLPSEKEMPWGISVNMPTGDQLTELRKFFEGFEWWRLVPDFDEGNAFKKTEKSGFYVAAHIDNDVYVVYLYNRSLDSAGKLVNMDKNSTYEAKWFDTRTGEYTVINDALTPDANGEYDIPQKPVPDDMILLVTKH